MCVRIGRGHYCRRGRSAELRIEIVKNLKLMEEWKGKPIGGLCGILELQNTKGRERVAIGLVLIKLMERESNSRNMVGVLTEKLIIYTKKMLGIKDQLMQ